MIRRVLKGAGVWALVMGLCVSLLWAVCAFIPQSSIQRGSELSSEFFSDHEIFHLLSEDRYFTFVDNYSDCVLLNVIYHTDSNDAFRSIVRSEMYHVEGRDMREDYRLSVMEGMPPDNDYSRYWHGSQVLLRPLLTFTSIEGCRRILFGAVLAMNAVLAVLLVRRRAFRALGIYAFGMLSIHFWMAYFAIQYVTTQLVSSAACIAVALMWDMPMQQRKQRMTAVSIASGAIVCFVDFLTCETIAFTIPAILWLLLYAESAQPKEGVKQLAGAVCRWGAAWAAAYAAAFALKWVLVLLVMGTEAFETVFTRASIRFDRVLNVVEGEGAYSVRESGVGLMLARNLGCLLPRDFELRVGGMLALFGGVAAAAGLCLYIFARKDVDLALLLALGLVALVPFARYLLLTGHTLDHYFYSYRALIAPVMALAAMLVYGTARPGYSHSKRRT